MKSRDRRRVNRRLYHFAMKMRRRNTKRNFRFRLALRLVGHPKKIEPTKKAANGGEVFKESNARDEKKINICRVA